ncbi:tetratricopeptide repeat protein, partial [candidate division WOR-3 bacterium]|nr:tetratricopeptide repeat protein [candidate division WOR-3 bacterium]
KIGLSKKISKEDIEREKEFDSNYVKGVTAYNSKNYKAAITFLEKCMKLKPENEDAGMYLEKAKVDFFVQCEGLKSAAVKLEEKKDYKGALIKYQELLYLDPDNKEISVKVDEMTEKILLEKKKKVKKKAPPGVSDREIDKWYKAGLSHFGNGNYKNAIAMFEKVLRYRPKHSGARKYLGKARTRLKATGQ